MSNNRTHDSTPKRSREDSTAYRIFFAFAAAVIIIFALLMVYRAYTPAYLYSTVRSILYYFIFIGFGLFAAGLILYLITRKIENKWPRRIGAVVLFFGLIVAFSCWAMYFFGPEIVKLLCVIFPLIAVYYLVYSIYPPDFFFSAVVAGITIIGLYLLSKLFGYSRSPLALTVNIGIAVISLAGALLAWLAQKNKGRLFGFSVFGIKTRYPIIYANCGVMLLCAILSLCFGAVVAHYCMYAAAALLFITAVYYTVKLM